MISGIFFLLPAISFAGYIIHLKDGGKIVTNECFEEGGQIKFKRFGGVIGIEKNNVLRIEKTEVPVEASDNKEKAFEAQAVSKEAEDTSKGNLSNDQGTLKKEKEKVEGETTSKEEIEKDAEDENKKLINKYAKEFDSIKEKFGKLSIMRKEDLHQFAEELLSFRQRVLTDRLGGPFAEKLTELYSMLDEVETAIKRRDY